MSNAKKRLRAAGIEANEVSASRFMHVPHVDLFVAPKGHPLFDPRSLDPVDEAIAADMADRVTRGEVPNTRALLVRAEGSTLLVVDGHGREKALRRAAEIAGRQLMPLVEFFQGDDRALLLERARRNDHDRFARKDAASVLAFRVKQLTAIGASEPEIVAAMPRGIGPTEVDALARWDTLTKELRPRFDAGEAPIGLLSSVLEVPRDEQPTRLDKLLAAGIRTARGAKRAENTERERNDEPRPRRMRPAKLLGIAKAIASTQIAEEEAGFARGFTAALKLAAGARTGKLPKAIADAVKGAA